MDKVGNVASSSKVCKTYDSIAAQSSLENAIHLNQIQIEIALYLGPLHECHQYNTTEQKNLPWKHGSILTKIQITFFGELE